MELQYKPDWEQCKKRLEALWDRELIDRCCISVKAPLDPDHPYVERKPVGQEELERYYMDETWILERKLEEMEKTYYGGDAFPCIFPYFGTGGHAKYLSSKVIYQPNTIWIPPVIEEYGDFDFQFDAATNENFQKERRIIAFLAKEGQGKFFVSPPDNCGSLDALSQLRGDSNLLMDLYDQPEEVLAAVDHLVDILNRTNDYIFSAIRENNDGGCVHGWMNVWSPGPVMQLQCDASVMISPASFKEIVVPELVKSAAPLTHGIYHMDGREQLRHLDYILGIPQIHMIQWVQVAGQPTVENFIPELRKIQESGRGLVIQIKKEQLDHLLSQLSPRGLNLIVMDACSRQEAEDIVSYVERYSYTREQLK